MQRNTGRGELLTKRGVIWLGQTCNLKCSFCYFIDRIKASTHAEHAFAPLEKAKKICSILAQVYRNNAVDIQGGEPTIYPGILELVRYCRTIELAPTIITNAIVLAHQPRLELYKEAGVADFLVSLHGMGETHDLLVGRKRTFERVIEALEHMQELKIDFRLNCVMSSQTLPDLPAMAKLAVTMGAKGINFIAHNQMGDQPAHLSKSCETSVPSYSKIRPYLEEALTILECTPVRPAVRYLPFCVLPEKYRKYFFNFRQLSYDPYEWDFGSWRWTNRKNQLESARRISHPVSINPFFGFTRFVTIQKQLDRLGFPTFRLYRNLVGLSNYDLPSRLREWLYGYYSRIKSKIHCGYLKPRSCKYCSDTYLCDGVPGGYIKEHKLDGIASMTLPQKARDVLHYQDLKSFSKPFAPIHLSTNGGIAGNR